jgi:hypothetical protein
MAEIRMSSLRGVCQTPAYVAYEKGLFRDAGLDVKMEIAARYIGISPDIIRHSFTFNRPDADAIRHDDAMNHILDLMLQLGYIERKPERYCDLRFMDQATIGTPQGPDGA